MVGSAGKGSRIVIRVEEVDVEHRIATVSARMET